MGRRTSRIVMGVALAALIVGVIIYFVVSSSAG